MERHGEKRVAGSSRTADRPAIERNKAVLGCHDEAHDPSHPSGNIEERTENLVDRPMSDIGDLAEMEQFSQFFDLLFHIFAEQREDEGRQKERAVDRFFGRVFPNFVVDYAEKIVRQIF